jgi:predicted ribonuclease YlaK
MSKKTRRAHRAKPSPESQLPVVPAGTTDHSPAVWQDKKLNWKLGIREPYPFSERQRAILDTALHSKTRCVFIDGIWGSSKTYLAVLAALKLLNTGRVDQILYVRNPVEASTTGKLGFIPGSSDEKMEPYCAPLFEKLDEMLAKPDLDRLAKEGRIKGMPLGFTRGRNWNCKAVIVDEAASMTWDDIMLLLSRCGEFTRIFFVGDSLNQNDIGSKSGFRRMFQTFDDADSKEHGVFAFELRETADIVRSGFLHYVMTKTGVIKG